jgi:hypothetical protein
VLLHIQDILKTHLLFFVSWSHAFKLSFGVWARRGSLYLVHALNLKNSHHLFVFVFVVLFFLLLFV